jgi:nucleolar protein 14
MFLAFYSCRPVGEILPNWSRTINIKALTQWVIDCVKVGPASNFSSHVKFSWFHGHYESSYKEAFEPILNAAMAVVKDCHNRLLGSVAYGEAMGPLIKAVSAIDTGHLSEDTKQTVNKVRSAMDAEALRSQSIRVPLTLRAKKTEVIETLEPRYEVNYRLQKDLDTDKARVQLKQLTRQSKREHKAAMRELRRDADFLDEEMFKARQAKAEKRREERAANYAWMEEQQATVNQQVRKGGALIKGGGSGAVRPIKRPKREKR